MVAPKIDRSFDMQAPATDWLTITPDDDTALNPIPRAIWCEDAGNLVIKSANGNQVTFTVEAKRIYPFRPRWVMAATDVTTVVGLY